MPVIKLKVPTLAQEKAMCCWHTSASMIWGYWQQQSGRAGPMNTLQRVYTDDTGLSPQAFITLAKSVGLRNAPTSNTYSSMDLLRLLRDYGPLWCAGYWYGAAHIIVLTGVDGNQVFINDPDQGQQKTGTLSWFNDKLCNSLSGCLMAKDPQAY